SGDAERRRGIVRRPDRRSGGLQSAGRLEAVPCPAKGPGDSRRSEPMLRLARTLSVAALALVVSASFAYARGGGPGGGGGGGRGGGMGGGGRAGGMGGGGRMGGGMGGARTGGATTGGGRMGPGSKGKNDSQQQEQEDRKNLIAERRARLADNDRASNQEARLATERLSAADRRVGDDIR